MLTPLSPGQMDSPFNLGLGLVNGEYLVQVHSAEPYGSVQVISVQIPAPPGEIGGLWSYFFPSEKVKQHFPDVYVGDTVFILGYPITHLGAATPDERAHKQKIIGTSQQGNVRLSKWWYKRCDVTTNPNAMTADAVHEHVKTPQHTPVKVVPKVKYKIINKGGRDDFVSL